MPKQDNTKTQTSQYDKIIKENLEVTLPVIIRDVLGLKIATSEELPDDIQHTKERKPDALKKVIDTDGNTYVLHVEFQVEDEKDMVFRMAEYSVMLMRKYRLPIKQYVIFLRDTKPAMPTYIDTPNHKYNFTLICMAEANYKLFLKAEYPEVKMLAILANFGNEDKYNAVKRIVDEVQSVSKSDFEESKYFNQMRIFVQLRSNIKPELGKAMESITKFFKEENDYFYQKGERKGELKGEIKGEIRGEEKKSRAVVENLIVKLGLSDEQAADIAAVSAEYVANIRAELKKK